MTLDLVRVAEQLPALLERVADERTRARDRLRVATSALRDLAADPAAWRLRLESAQTRWPLALPLHERADRGFRPPPLDPPYAVLAVDGSHIDVDRHAPARCFVLNLGWSAIFYGADLAPELDSCAELQPSSASLVERDEQDASGEHELRGETLSLLRGVRELAQLAALAERLPPDLPQVLLLDGNLGLWNVSQAPISRRMRDRFIYEEGGLLPALNAARRLAEERTLACGAYTSAPGTAEVVHALRAGVCPMDEPVCTHCPGLGRPLRPCDDVGLTTDAELFEALLAPGERSAVFQATSRAFLRTDQPRTPPWYEQEGHTIAFFYLRLADEVARVETPLWLAQRPERVGLLHAALLDQCEKGPGYPVALQEAHEQAVITTVDRRSFAALLERELERAGTAFAGTAKSRSKRVRTI